MKVRITQIVQARPEAATVRFSAMVGDAEARWHGARPLEGGEYQAEIAIPDVLTWGDGIRPTAGQPGFLFPKGHAVGLTGQMVRLGEDGVAEIRLGDDIVLVEVAGLAGIDAPLPCIVEIAVPRLELYDANL